MEEKEYLQTLGEQILNPHARTHVLEEIQEHIDEQMQDYIDTGMSPDAAEKEAVRQMGDPVAAGTELNRIHRPRFPGVLFGIAVALTLSGIFMQYILYGSEPLNTTYSNTVFMQHAVFYQVIGFGIILFGMFSNYMCLSKYSCFYTVCFWDSRCSPASFRARSLSGRPVPLAIICVCCIHCPMHCCYTPTGKKDGKSLSGCMCCHSCFSERS